MKDFTEEEIVRILKSTQDGWFPPESDVERLAIMARRTLLAEEGLAKAQKTICFFSSVIKSGEGWSKTCQKEMDEALGRPKALHPPAQCAPPVEPDVQP